MDGNILDTIDLRELGAELQKARERRGMTQQDAAGILAVARTTITAIEKGDRKIKAGELIKLAGAYGREVSDFVRPRPEIAPFEPQFRGPLRRMLQDTSEIDAKIELLEELSRNYLELEQITATPLTQKYPNEYDTSGVRIEQVAESVAIEERNRLGLGDGPLGILRDILERDVGLRIFYIPLPNKFSEIYLYDHVLGGCLAINSLHPEERRRWSLAHGYAHFLAHRYRPTVDVEGGYERLPESERFADYFANFFLMPTSRATRHFNDIYRARQTITSADLCSMAYYYGVSVAALTHRLEEMRLIPTGTWDILRRKGFKVREAQRELGLSEIPGRADMLPIRYQYLALDALDQALISEGQFARFLGVERLEARLMAETLRQDSSSGTDDIVMDFDLTESLGG